jgi:thioredoxin 1
MSSDSTTNTTTALTPLTSKIDYLKISNADGLHIIEASASWCAQCKAIAPEIEKMISEYPKAKFYVFDVDEQPDIAQELGVRVMPTFNIFKDGDLMEGISGAKVKPLREAVEKNLS